MNIRNFLFFSFSTCILLPSFSWAYQSDWCNVPAVSFQSNSDIPPQIISELNKGPQPLRTLHMDATNIPANKLRAESSFRNKAFHRLNVIQNSVLYGYAYSDPTLIDDAKKSLLAWTSTYKPTLDPIDETEFDTLIRSFAILKPTMSQSQVSQLNKYFSQWGWSYIHEMELHKKDWTNNFQSHRIKLVTMIAVATSDKALFEKARYFFRLQIFNNISANGMPLDFKERDAIHYAVYDLQPLVQAAIDAKSEGEDWYNWKSESGSSLAGSVSWLLPYINGDKKHIEFVHSKHPIDKKRAEAHYSGFSGDFNPKSASTLMWLISALDPKYRSLASHLNANEPLYLQLCGQ